MALQCIAVVLAVLLVPAPGISPGAHGGQPAQTTACGVARARLPARPNAVQRHLQLRGGAGVAKFTAYPGNSSWYQNGARQRIDGSRGPPRKEVTAFPLGSENCPHLKIASPRRLNCKTDDILGRQQCSSKTTTLIAVSQMQTLNFTGGYMNNEHCSWTLTCSRELHYQDPEILLSFNSLNTEADYDIVRVFDASQNTLVEQLSGYAKTVPMLGVLGPNVSIEFVSDRSNTADGFSANFSCQSAGTVDRGCTDPASPNYSPKAQIDDNSCLTRCSSAPAVLLPSSTVTQTLTVNSPRMATRSCDWEIKSLHL